MTARVDDSLGSRARVARIDWPCTLVANADDPLVVGAVEPRSPDCRVVWVGGGLTWSEDVQWCPVCGAPALLEPDGWRCVTADVTTPVAEWTVSDGEIHGRENAQRIEPNSPGA